jgi:hypothetical protein
LWSECSLHWSECSLYWSECSMYWSEWSCSNSRAPRSVKLFS